MKTHTSILATTALLIGAFAADSALFAQTPSLTESLTESPNFTVPQGQASNLAVPQPAEASPSSIMAIVYCNKISGLAVIDSEGTIHPITLEGMKPADVMKIMQLVPADRVKSANMGCPGNPSKDTTVL